MTTSTLKLSLAKVKKVFHKYFYIEDDSILDLVFGAYIANRLRVDALWLMIIAAPSNMKTELLNALSEHETTYAISTMTPQTLISGRQVKAGNAPPSLLFQLNDLVVLIKDFTTILSMRSEPRAELLAQLREVYDGSLKKAFGTGDVVEWSGKVAVIGASTNVYDKHSRAIGAMGERFFLARCEPLNGTKMGIQAQKMFGKEVQMRKEIQEISHKFMDQFKSPPKVKFETNKDSNFKIVQLACFVALGRCPVDRDRIDKTICYQPEPEGTPRLVKQFQALGTGIAMAQGKTEIDGEVYQVLKKAGADQLPRQRLHVVRHLWELRAFDGAKAWRKSKEIAEAVNLPTKTARRILEDYMVIGVVNRDLENTEKDTAAYLWQIGPEMYKLMSETEVFE